ncbi:metalloendopeptidase OMA1, mitochondrial-like [Argiope bruennichi]|uniref:Metalloendopeptidase OMA1, mitochondrial n=1 Tax=Argiope bruennichi TaxID=94029 RepID=A0A8T0FWA6_ARGBR|nr:metalloendopeptidase OMA1, mitochondrial-like [Argiope bruennichi]KAF8794555.1 Metalloendopeptidase OMA1 like protein [Argiope bruennichi]
MSLLTYFFIPRSRMILQCLNNVKFPISERRTFTFQYISSSKTYFSLPFKNRLISNSEPCTVKFLSWTSQKSFNFRISVYRTFRTSPPRNVHPAVWIVLRPALKVAAVVTGRGIRKWWRNLPKDKKRYFLNELKANRRKIGIALSLILCLSVGYYLSHLELTPITKRRRFMAFNPKQLDRINEFELEQIMENFGPKMLPPNHPAVRRVERVVRRIIAANADIKELEGKKFGISVIDSTIENAFVIPLGHVFVFSGMLNLCSNDDQLGIILSHEIAHCIMNHGAENVSFVHLLDLISLVIIAAIWAVIPNDSVSLLSHWLYQKCIQLFLELPYNRTIEVEADFVGLQLAAKACFDVRESSAFWNKMAFLSKTFGNGPEIEFLSTHPSHEKRSEYLDSLMEQALQLRSSCGCPRLSYRDPRLDVATANLALELTRRKFFELNKKPENIFKV